MIYAIVAVLILIADQAVKLWTTQNIVLGAAGDECAALIPGFIHATNLHNYGAAFGIFQDARWPLAIVSALFAIVIIVLINKEVIHTPFGRWTAVLIVAGALGNCIDRVLYGYVVDMFEFEFALFGRAFSFPVFNVADIFITVSGILFCIHLIFYNEPEAVKAANEPEFMRRRHAAERTARAAEPTGAHAAPAARSERGARTERAAHTRTSSKKPPASAPAPASAAESTPDIPEDVWSFGGEIPAAPAPAPAERERPAAKRVSSDHLAYEPELPTRRVRAQAPAESKKTAPAPAPAEDKFTNSDAFTLDDILSEFRDG